MKKIGVTGEARIYTICVCVCVCVYERNLLVIVSWQFIYCETIIILSYVIWKGKVSLCAVLFAIDSSLAILYNNIENIFIAARVHQYAGSSYWNDKIALVSDRNMMKVLALPWKLHIGRHVICTSLNGPKRICFGKSTSPRATIYIRAWICNKIIALWK